MDILGCTDFWLCFEWQHRGSPHVHGLAWLSNAPNVEEVLASHDNLSQKQDLLRFIDSLVSTTNPAVLPDSSNLQSAPLPMINPHVCARVYSQIEDYRYDLAELIATCQRHTKCSTSYCLRNKEGQQVCRFGYPKPLLLETTISNENDETEVITARNDGLLNSFNPIQLSGWRANVDMKYIVSRQKVIQYCAKYAMKSEPRSQPMREIFEKFVHSLKNGNTSLTVVQKLLINSIGERDYSAQETCHLLLQLPMYNASRDFVILSVDGSRLVELNSIERQPVTTPSILDCYIARPSTPLFNDMTLLTFAKAYCRPKQPSVEPTRRRKEVIVVVRPYYSADRNGPQYENYCRQKLMLHICFRQISDLLGEYDTYAEAYADFLSSSIVPPSLQDDIHELEQISSDDDGEETHEVMHHILLCTIQLLSFVSACMTTSVFLCYLVRTESAIKQHPNHH